MTLTELNYYSRKFAPLGIILALVGLILFFGIKLLLVYLSSQPSTSDTSTTAQAVSINPTFGKIKRPVIVEAKSPSKFTLILDTLDGTANVSEGTGSAQIYFIPQQTASFGFLSKIYQMAQAAGFDTDITQHRLDGRTAIFDDGRQRLTIDIRTFNFTFTYTVTTDDNVGIPADPPSETNIISQTTSFVSNIGRYPTELSQGDKHIMYMRFDPGTKQITPLDSPVGANMAEVDFYRPDLNGLPVVSSTYYNSPHYVMYLLGGGEQSIIRGQVSFFEQSKDQVGLYPLRSGQEAWEDMQKGEGYVVSSVGDGGEVRIKKVFLAYYDPAVYQEYLQPVYVFLGENRFVAYVAAVNTEYLLE